MNASINSDDLKSFIRDVPDFPKPGIVFKDITPLLQDPDALRRAVKAMTAPFLDGKIDKVAGIESRGFIFGVGAALELGVGFVPVRKKGKLPAKIIAETYALEYGSDTIEIHADAFRSGERVLLVDDLLATGGTAAAALSLLRRGGATVAGAAFLIELEFLEGRKRLAELPITRLLSY